MFATDYCTTTYNLPNWQYGIQLTKNSHALIQVEIERICQFAGKNPSEGYRRMTFAKLDSNVVARGYVEHYNTARLHSAIGYVTPQDKLLGNDAAIHAERERKLAEARERPKQQQTRQHERRQELPDPSRSAIDFPALRASITIVQVLTLLGFVPRFDRPGQQHGPCPIARLDAWRGLLL